VIFTRFFRANHGGLTGCSHRKASNKTMGDANGRLHPLHFQVFTLRKSVRRTRIRCSQKQASHGCIDFPDSTPENPDGGAVRRSSRLLASHMAAAKPRVPHCGASYARPRGRPHAARLAPIYNSLVPTFPPLNTGVRLPPPTNGDEAVAQPLSARARSSNISAAVRKTRSLDSRRPSPTTTLTTGCSRSSWRSSRG
jgi:hypothetical protein